MRRSVQRAYGVLAALPAAVPLRVSVPVLLLAVPALVAGFLVQRETAAAHARIQREGIDSVGDLMRGEQRRLETLALRGDTDLLREEVAALGADPELTLAMIARPDGVVLAATRLQLLELPTENALEAAAIPDAASLDAELEAARILGEPQVRLGRFKRQHVVGMFPLQLAGGARDGGAASAGVMLVIRSIAAAQAGATRQALASVAPLLALLLAMAGFIWLWFHGALSRRVGRLVEAARRAGEQGGRVRVSLSGSDELARIGAAFDEMVSALDRSQQQARMNDRLATVGTLASGVAHEINNPLAYAINNLDYAHEAVASGEPLHGLAREELKAALAEALEGAQRVKKIAADLKTLSRREGDALGPVDVRAVVESALNIAAHELRQKARVVRSFGDVPPALGEAGRLGQVALNLLVNAAQALPADGAATNEVRVSVAQVGEQIALDVEDTGPGIPADVLPRIFDPFFTTKPAGQGTGLGLSICASLIASMGGRIEVQSEPGRGARFRVWLKVAGAPSVAIAPASQPAAPVPA